MSEITKETVVRVAKLAHIRLSDDEIESYTSELGQIFDWIEQLQQVDTEGVAQMTSVVEGTALPRREDVANDGHCPEKVLANAPKSEFGCFAVPKVIE